MKDARCWVRAGAAPRAAASTGARAALPARTLKTTGAHLSPTKTRSAWLWSRWAAWRRCCATSAGRKGCAACTRRAHPPPLPLPPAPPALHAQLRCTTCRRRRCNPPACPSARTHTRPTAVPRPEPTPAGRGAQHPEGRAQRSGHLCGLRPLRPPVQRHAGGGAAGRWLHAASGTLSPRRAPRRRWASLAPPVPPATSPRPSRSPGPLTPPPLLSTEVRGGKSGQNTEAQPQRSGFICRPRCRPAAGQAP